MAICEILEEIMKERGVSIADMARICNLPDSTVRGIIRRKQETVALEVAFKLSDGLGVSLEKLNGMPEKLDRQDSEPNPLRSTLLQNFDQLNQEGQERLVETSDDMVSSGKYIKTSANQLGNAKYA